MTSAQAGALAGTTVDLSLYPIDTLKTRLQSSAGFFPSGGFTGVYRGVGSAIVGSAPGASLFFVTYDGIKRSLTRRQKQGVGVLKSDAAIHMLAASAGEVAACAVRVPTEVVKQRAQAGQYASSLLALKSILGQYSTVGVAGVWKEMYRGWSVTIMREVPFTVIQFPLWEALKKWSHARRLRTMGTRNSATPGAPVNTTFESALFGSMSGAVAAALTTPLDVLKTRLMLAKEKVPALTMLRRIVQESGTSALFSGIAPRIMWISAGGAIFLGSYQWAINRLGGEGETQENA